MAYTSVKDLLQAKASPRVWTIAPDKKVFDALSIMGERNIGSLLVTDGPHIVGIITERDYARKVILRNRSSRDTKISEIMSTNVLYVKPLDSLDNCMALMTERHVRHLPVLDEGRLVGVISIGDVVKAKITDQEFMIDQLTHYITGTNSVTQPYIASRVGNG